jgi:hypothetical protein
MRGFERTAAFDPAQYGQEIDEECLEIATSIRVVIADLAECMGHALKEEAEIGAAVNRLLARKVAKAEAVEVEAVEADLPSPPESK